MSINQLKTLYIEHKDGIPLTPEKQTGIVYSSEIREATEQEVKEAKKYFAEHGKCKYHLVYDKHGFDWDLRYCGICNNFICLI